jgi:hypothetical protein
MQSKQSLVDQAIEQMKMDISAGDWTAIEELLMLVPEENLSGFLSDNATHERNIHD